MKRFEKRNVDQGSLEGGMRYSGWPVKAYRKGNEKTSNSKGNWGSRGVEEIGHQTSVVLIVNAIFNKRRRNSK